MSDLELAEKNMKELEYIYSKEKKEEKDNIKTINNNKGKNILSSSTMREMKNFLKII